MKAVIDNVKPNGKYSVIETANVLGVTPKTIYNWLNAGNVFKATEFALAKYGKRKTRILGSAIQRVWGASL